MQIRDILASKGTAVATIASSARALDAVAELRNRGIGALVVSGDGRAVDGIVSERDVVHALADHGAQLPDTPVRELMTASVTTCTPLDDVNDVLRTMTTGRFRHVPVVEDGGLRALVSIGDLVKARIEDLEHERAVLHDYVSG